MNAGDQVRADRMVKHNVSELKRNCGDRAHEAMRRVALGLTQEAKKFEKGLIDKAAEADVD